MRDHSIETIEARLAAATPEPWSYDGWAAVWRGTGDGAVLAHLHRDPRTDADGALISNAPADLRLLLDVAKVARDLMQHYPNRLVGVPLPLAEVLEALESA